MRKIDLINEFSYTTQTKEWFHGTSVGRAGEAILKDGFIKAPSLELTNARYGNAFQRPVDGRAYISPSLKYSVIYTLGGVMMGHEMSKRHIGSEPLGYLFTIDGSEIQDAEPDEDALGYIVYKLAYLDDESEYDDYPELAKGLRENPKLVSELSYQVRKILTPKVYDMASRGDSIWQSKAGKKLVKMLPTNLKHQIIDLGTSISVPNKIKWNSAWSFDKALSIDLTPDASNFFDLAEKVG